jgi:hypothetical protein
MPTIDPSASGTSVRPHALPGRFGALWFEFRADGFRCLCFARNLFDRTHLAGTARVRACVKRR